MVTPRNLTELVIIETVAGPSPKSCILGVSGLDYFSGDVSGLQ